MTFDNYQTNASRTAFYPRVFKNQGLYYTALGLAGEEEKSLTKLRRL